MHCVRLGIIGFGGMGQIHGGNVLAGKINRCELTAVCDALPANLRMAPNALGFTSPAEFFESKAFDAVLIATPHYAHTTMGIAALEAGYHVMVEKPISVHVADAQRLLAAHAKQSHLVFAAMFNQRTDPHFLEIRHLIREGQLGTVRRVQWTITDWFRTAAYYGNDGWRATWAGEGGGVLLNQSPHQLDLLQWLFGMPARVSGFCSFGRYHAIEVEDDVTAYLEYPDGMHATFITSTGEAPGTNRLEIAAERGRLVYEHDRLTWTKNIVGMSEFSSATTDRFAKPPSQEIVLNLSGHGGQHVGMLQNFVNAILDGTPLLAPAREGVASVELANAILLSSWRGASVALPLDGSAYECELLKRAGGSASSRS